VLAGADAAFDAGTFTALCGPSGCGKSTLLLILGAMLHPDAGSVTVAGENLLDMPRNRRGRRRAGLLGFVFQRFHLLPYLTVEENIRAASVALPGVRDDGRTEDLMRRLGILERRHHLPGRLSVGEQQRTALARALYNRPSVLLADEPTGNLDAANTEIVLETFREFTADGGTVVMVTHNEQAAARAHRVWRLAEGRLVAER